jgi:hypothetical protein
MDTQGFALSTDLADIIGIAHAEVMATAGTSVHPKHGPRFEVLEYDGQQYVRATRKQTLQFSTSEMLAEAAAAYEAEIADPAESDEHGSEDDEQDEEDERPLLPAAPVPPYMAPKAKTAARGSADQPPPLPPPASPPRTAPATDASAHRTSVRAARRQRSADNAEAKARAVVFARYTRRPAAPGLTGTATPVAGSSSEGSPAAPGSPDGAGMSPIPCEDSPSPRVSVICKGYSEAEEAPPAAAPAQRLPVAD